MGKKDASTIKLPVDQYRKQIEYLHLFLVFTDSKSRCLSNLPEKGKQDYKKTKPILRATKLKAEAKKTAIGIKEVGLVLAAILALLLAFYAFFYLRLSADADPDLEPDED
uniref:Triple QxxK/R motif-containing protein n=1 Tax=Sus scrofa TaxID=9823 RepID=A0A8D0XZV8_PIG